MIQIDLGSKKIRSNKGKNWTKIVAFSFFGVFVVYFLSVSAYVVVTLVGGNGKIKKIDSQSESISSQMLSNNEKLSKYVLTKLVLNHMVNENKVRFRYLDYLDEVSSALPPSSSISSVDFKTRGMMSVTVRSENATDLMQLENVILKEDTWKNLSNISGAYIESVIRDKKGVYSTKLQLELKNGK